MAETRKRTKKNNSKKKKNAKPKKRNVKFFCPECKNKLKLKSYRDGYKTCYYCGLVIFKTPFATADDTVTPEVIKKVTRKKKQQNKYNNKVLTDADVKAAIRNNRHAEKNYNITFADMDNINIVERRRALLEHHYNIRYLKYYNQQHYKTK